MNFQRKLMSAYALSNLNELGIVGFQAEGYNRDGGFMGFHFIKLVCGLRDNKNRNTGTNIASSQCHFVSPKQPNSNLECMHSYPGTLHQGHSQYSKHFFLEDNSLVAATVSTSTSPSTAVRVTVSSSPTSSAAVSTSSSTASAVTTSS